MSSEKKFPYYIRWALGEEWEDIMEMVWRTFLRFEANDYTEEGIANFKDFITDPRLFHMFMNGQYATMIAVYENKIIGQISVRSGNHISLLFVDEAYHKMGVGRELIREMAEFLIKDRGAKSMTVQAAPYAVDFYRKVGFQICAPEEEYSGIRVTSMEKFL